MFLANENCPRPSIILLRENGISVKSIQEDSPGISDVEVMKLAIALNLIILTFDRDYGELTFRYANTNPPSIIYFREKGGTPKSAGTTLLNLLTNKTINFPNAFIVIEEKNIRQRFYTNINK